MPVKRRKSKARDARITEQALQLFTEMLALECTCPPRDWGDWPGRIVNNHDSEAWDGWLHECPGCKEWWRLHSELHDELRCRPYEWPCIQSPHARNPWPLGSNMFKQWKPDLEAQALWRELEAAVAEGQSSRN